VRVLLITKGVKPSVQGVLAISRDALTRFQSTQSAQKQMHAARTKVAAADASTHVRR